MNRTDLDVRAEEYVDTGIARLGTKKWRWKMAISLTALNVRDPTRCPLAQIHGNYRNGLERMFGGDVRAAGMCGFALGGDEFMTWDALQRAWVKKLTPIVAEVKRKKRLRKNV